MKTIYKYPFHVGQFQIVNLPRGAEILTAQEQDNQLFIWAKVDAGEGEFVSRTISVFGTGHAIVDDKNLKYLCTVVTKHSEMVWHVFEHVQAPNVLVTVS
jgi:hypothetical protein